MFGLVPRSFLCIFLSVMITACVDLESSDTDDESVPGKKGRNTDETVQHAINIEPTPTSTPRPTPVIVRTAHQVEPAADFGLKLLTGEEIRLSEFIGSVVVLNFWASWCGPCKVLKPLMEELSSEMSDTMKFYYHDIDSEPNVPSP